MIVKISIVQEEIRFVDLVAKLACKFEEESVHVEKIEEIRDQECTKFYGNKLRDSKSNSFETCRIWSLSTCCQQKKALPATGSCEFYPL